MSDFQLRVRESRRAQDRMFRDIADFAGGFVETALGFLLFFLMLAIAGVA